MLERLPPDLLPILEGKANDDPDEVFIMSRENLVYIMKTVRDQTATSFILGFISKKVVDKKLTYEKALNFLQDKCPIESNPDWPTLLRETVDSAEQEKAVLIP